MINFNYNYGLTIKFIAIPLIIIITTIFAYSQWYNFILKKVNIELSTLKKNLITKNIDLSWNKINTKGFPFRIEIELENIYLSHLHYNAHAKNITIVQHPWNLNHIILISNQLKASIKDKNNIIDIHLIESSKVSFKKRNQGVRLSIVAKNTIFKSNFKEERTNNNYYRVNNYEIHFFNPYSNKDALLATKFYNITLPKNHFFNDSINSILLDTNIIDFKNIDYNDISQWLQTSGGLDINNIEIDSKKLSIKGAGYLSFDKNLYPLGTFVLNYNGLSNVINNIEKNEVLSKTLIKALYVAAKASESLAAFKQELPQMSLMLQEGYLYIFGIKILKIF